MVLNGTVHNFFLIMSLLTYVIQNFYIYNLYFYIFSVEHKNRILKNIYDS